MLPSGIWIRRQLPAQKMGLFGLARLKPYYLPSVSFLPPANFSRSPLEYGGTIEHIVGIAQVEFGLLMLGNAKTLARRATAGTEPALSPGNLLIWLGFRRRLSAGSLSAGSERISAPGSPTANRHDVIYRGMSQLARSIRPFAAGELAQMISMLSSLDARPNWVTPSPPRLRLIDAEHGILVAAEGDGLAVTVEISASSFKVTEGRL